LLGEWGGRYRVIGDAAMNIMPRASHWDELIRRDRVHGSLYTDPTIFEAELQNIWYRTWVYVGHESEVPNPNDYVAKSIGPQSIIMTRDEQGKINLLLNRCTHRGNQVCSYEGQCPILHLSIPLVDLCQ
jgi:hypothetical protein